MEIPLHVSGVGPTAAGAILRSDMAYLELLGDRRQLDCGIAIVCDRFGGLSGTNQLRDFTAGEGTDVSAAVEAIDGCYGERGVACGKVVLAENQGPGVVDEGLGECGFARLDSVAMTLGQWPVVEGADGVRVLPARAMRRAFRSICEKCAGTCSDEVRENVVEAAEERLDDHRMDMFVAMVGKEPAGMCGLFQVGDIGRVVDLYVVPSFRRRGIGTALLMHVISMSRRLLLQTVCAKVTVDAEAAGALLEKLCFVRGGHIVEYHRSTAF